jgi:curved DNA-binding protein CbpA
MNDPYRILGVDPETANDDNIRQAYLEGLREHPPERDPESFRRLRDAYDRIASHRLRLEHELFFAEVPDVADLAAHVLTPGAPRRPDVATVRAALAAGLESS